MAIEPSAATTETTTSLLPVCKPERPTTETNAAGSLAKAKTETEVEPAGNETVSPEATEEPATSKVARLLSELKAATTKVTVKVREAPDSAVTTTVKVFDPVTRPARPETTAEAFASVAVATTETELVPLANETVEPAVTTAPLTVNTAKLVSVERAVTRKVTV